MLLLQLFIKRKKQFLEEEQNNRIQFLNEINQAKIEIKDQTLKQVAHELHDNVGQIIALSRIHVKALQKNISDDRLTELNTLTEKALNEIRGLSRLLNTDMTRHLNLGESIKSLLDSIDKSGTIRTQLTMEGDARSFAENTEMILFRIVQESISNSLKYAQCNEISVTLNYLENNNFSLVIKDNGKGFNVQEINKGNGFRNMEQRAKFIDAYLQIHSQPNQGTSVQITLKK